MTDKVLLVDDDQSVREALGQTLELADLSPVLAASFVEAKDHITSTFAGVILSDIRMPGRDGFHLLDYARGMDPDLPVILLTGEADVPMAVRAMDHGAHSFLEKPCAPADLVDAVKSALMRRRDVLEARRGKLASESGDAAARMLFGASALAVDLRDRVRSVARAGGVVLITGEPGSGTSKVAEVIHLLSVASHHPFVKRAAAGLDPAALARSIDEAGEGTLYLDEVSALPSATQFMLAEALEVQKSGRIIAACTRDLGKDVAAGSFSADLYYRLDLMRVKIPALRDRTEDIPILFRQYVAQACEQANLPVPVISQDLIARLMAQSWAGNARGLMNAAMRHAMGLTEFDEVQGLGLADQMARVEKSLLIDALRRHGGHASETARDLKLPRKTFYDKLTRHGLRPEDFRRTDQDRSTA